MPNITSDIIIFILFLGANLLIGLIAGRKVKTLRDFSIGNKDFSTATITSTIVATWTGGGFMFYALQNIYTNGLQFIIPLLGTSICLLFTGRVLAIRMGEFLNNLSVAEAIGNLYGTIIRVITALSGILAAIGYIAIQFQVFAKMLTFLLGFKGPGVIMAAAFIVILYSAFGGIRSVTITDVFQFIAFIIFIPILGLIVWRNLNSSSQLLNTLANNPNFSLRETFSWNAKFLSTIGLMFYFAIPGMTPAIFQRVSIAKDLKQVKDSFTYAAGIDFLITASITWIAILLLLDNPSLEPSNLVNHIIINYAYSGLKGLIAVGISAMAMSTADSDLNAAAILAVNDIIRPLNSSWKISIKTVRIFTLVLGLCALVLALHTTDLLELLLISGSFYMPIVTVPLLLAIFGFRSTTRAVLIGMVAGLITTVLWDTVSNSIAINRLVPGMITNFFFLMGAHYLLKEKGGWIGIKDPYPLLAARQERQNKWRNLIQAIRQPSFYAYLNKNLPTKEIVYSLFGLYVLGATYACFFTIPEEVVTSYQTLYDHIAHSVLVMTAGFITYPAWPPTFKSKHFISIAWPVGISYILFVVGTILMVLSGFHQVQVMLFVLNLVLAALLLDWRLMLGLIASGSLLAIGAFYLYTGGIPQIHVSETCLQFKVIYGLPLFISFLFAITNFRQSKDQLEDKTNYLLMIQKKEKDRLVELAGYREELLKELHLQPEEMKIFDHVTSEYLKQAIYRVRDYLRLDLSEVSLNILLSDIRALLKIHQVKPCPQLVIKQITEHYKLQADIPKIKQLLVNSISYIQAHNPNNTPIIINIEETRLGYECTHMQDYIRKLDALRFIVTTHKEYPPVEEVYIHRKQENSKLLLTADFLPLVENARIINAHYGYADQEENRLHIYIIPVNGSEVRDKIMELTKHPIEADPAELNHPLAIQLEKELLDKLHGTAVNMQLIRKALNIIKKYYGGIKRRSGEPYFTHPISVVLILLKYTQDQDPILAALLHDIIEDTSLTLSDIQAMFGDSVGMLVDKAGKLENKLKKINPTDYESVYTLLDSQDKSIALIKLADRLHNIRTIQGHPSISKQKRIADETLAFFVPIAKYLCLTDLVEELERSSFEILGQ